MSRRALLAILLVATCAPACRGTAASNRDPKGPADVERYVAVLERPERVEELRPELVIETLAPARDAVVADVGCGPGVFAVPFARACPDGFVLAIDVEPRQLDALRARIAAEGVGNVVPVLASPADPHVPPGLADLLFVADTYHHLEDRVAYFAALRDALAPGGRLAILEYLPGDLPIGPPADHKLPEGVRERELGEAGWTRAESFDTHTWHDFEVWVPGE